MKKVIFTQFHIDETRRRFNKILSRREAKEKKVIEKSDSQQLKLF